jgi:hypothetical protein
VKFKFTFAAAVFALAAFFALAAPAKEKSASSQMIDSGSFGVFVNGRRVATETFSVQQGTAGSTADSQFKTEAGVDPAVQTSQLQLTSAGELLKYQWKEVSPGSAQAVVMPNNDFLMERASNNPREKEQEHPFLLPASTSILDDYFFVQREILAWKYLATGCRRENGQVQCPMNQKVQFGTLNPHSRSSMLVSLEFAGREKVAVHGVDRELNRFTLKSDGGEWAMWLDDQFKLVRILIPSDSTEVVRD